MCCLVRERRPLTQRILNFIKNWIILLRVNSITEYWSRYKIQSNFSKIHKTVRSKFIRLDLNGFVCSLSVIAKLWKMWWAEHAAHILFGRSRGIIQISKPTSSHRDASQWILRKERSPSDRSEIAPTKSYMACFFYYEDESLGSIKMKEFLGQCHTLITECYRTKRQWHKWH
jgi:hypothetical protein